jgi:predicted Ser/Thr protein kinase
MGVVYLGRDPVIGRLVALKTIRVAAEDDVEQREFNERFLREAQAAGTLSHPNIVTVHDVGEEDEVSFIAMEYVEGKNLKQVIREKERLSFERIAEIISEVAGALDYAHRKGIVHRDVKPANIIITPDGTVKITDFGIAKIETSSLTETGQFLGTPNYMSPEQVTGEAVDGRSDLFSLGVVLYELLTRKKPFLGDNVTSISYKIVHEDFAPLKAADAAIPSEFGPILAKALSKDPAARYQRGAEFSQALSEVRARQAEYQMIRDLGEMVAQAEKLGPVAPVEAAPAPATPAPPRTAGPETTARISAMPPATPEVTGSLEALARRRDDLNPQLVGVAPAPGVDSSGPDWSLDTDAVRRPAARDTAPREPVPSSPGTLISDLPRIPPKAAAPEVPGLPEGSVSTRPVSTPRPVIPALKLDEKGAVRPPEPRSEPRPSVRPVPSLDVSGLPRAGDAPPAARRAPAVTPPALPDGAGPGPRPPALPPDATGSLRRAPGAVVPPPTKPFPPRPGGPPSGAPGAPAGPAERSARIVEETSLGGPPPAPPPRERPPTPRPEPQAAPVPRDRPAPVRLETAPAPAPKERTAPLRTEPAPAREKAPPAAPQPAGESAAASETLEGVLRREVNRTWARAVVGLTLVPALAVVVLLFARSRQLVPSGEGEGTAVEAAVVEKRHLLDDGNRLLSDGRIEEARQRFLELARLAPESAAARDALRRTERLLAKKAEQDRRSAEVERQLAAARAAQAGGDPAAAAAAAEAALAVEPDHADAQALRRAAADEIRRLPKAEQRRAEARLRALRSAAPPPKPVPSAEAAGATAGAAGPAVRLAFRSPFAAGTVFVRMNGTEVLRRSFDFGGKAGGVFEANLELPARSGELRAWVFSADGDVRGYAVTRLDLAEGAARSVILGLDRAQKLSVGVE